MKTYKAFIVIATLLLVVAGTQPAAQAALSGMVNGCNYCKSMDSVSFYLYDQDNSRDAMLNADTLSFFPSCNKPALSLEYNINNKGWNDLNGPLSIDYGSADLVQISFRLDPNDNNNGNQSISAGNVTFQTYDEASSDDVGLDLFQALYVVWDTNHQSMVTFCSADDPVTPHAPIPASALLLFTGLIGLIGFRRRMND